MHFISCPGCYQPGAGPWHVRQACRFHQGASNDKYQETGKALAIAGQVNLVEVFASKAGTWTILVTTPEGKSCIIAAGNSWEDLPPSKNLTSL